jgi:LysR family cyn operon transcriptional activator
VELRHLRYFLAAAQSQNFTVASNQLYITQPTLSHQIKQLEDELGVALFVRIGRSVHLTAAGEIFRAYAKRSLQEVEQGKDALHDLENLKHGRLTVGVLSTFGTFILPPILASFNAAYPGIKITVLRLRSGEIEKRLLDGELNLGVANAPASTDQIEVDPLIDDFMALLVGDQHPLAARTSVALEEIREHGLILPTPEFNSRQLIDATFAANGITPRVIMEMNAIEPILSTVRLSTLSTILSAAMAQYWPGLHVVKITPTVTRTVAFFTRRNTTLPAAALAFSEAVRRGI